MARLILVGSPPAANPPETDASRGRRRYRPCSVAQVRNIRPGYVVVHPNRDKAACKLVRLLVVAVLLASVVVMLVLTIGGWSKLEGLKPVNFVWMLLYLIIAVYIW